MTGGVCDCHVPFAACRYWDTRPTAVITRITQLMLIAGSFISGLVSDVATGTEQQLHGPASTATLSLEIHKAPEHDGIMLSLHVSPHM